jgi:hypothetical protein
MGNRKVVRTVDSLRTYKQKLDEIIRTVEGLESPRLQRRAASHLREIKIKENEKQIFEILHNQDSNLLHLKEVAAASE